MIIFSRSIIDIFRILLKFTLHFISISSLFLFLSLCIINKNNNKCNNYILYNYNKNMLSYMITIKKIKYIMKKYKLYYLIIIILFNLHIYIK